MRKFIQILILYEVERKMWDIHVRNKSFQLRYYDIMIEIRVKCQVLLE